MQINQDVIDDTVVGITEYVSYLSTNYLNMIINRDFLEVQTADRLMYLINLGKSLQNYDYDSGNFTDDELQHLLEQITISSDELPNNSNYGGR